MRELRPLHLTRKGASMPVTVEFTNIIERPLSKVFDFFARNHVRNHPRWDPDIKLEATSDAPIGVGTIIRRVNSRSGTPVEGTMEVVEFEPDRVMGVLIHDGPVEMRGRVQFEAVTESRTRLITTIEIPGADESKFDRAAMMRGLERSALNQRQLMEAEL
jgi:uncharacterized membrane protein